MDRRLLIKRVLMLTLLALPLVACRTQSTALPAVLQTKQASIPALPLQAKQQPAPSWCLPTCSSALMKERETWRKHMTDQE